MRRVHGEATECVMFMGRQRNASCSSGGLGRNRRWKRGLVYHTTEETALCSTGHVRNRILFIRRGLAYRKTEEMDLLRSKRGLVDREGPGVPQNGGNGPPTVETGVLLIGRGVAYRKTEETDLLRSKRGRVHREGCGVPQNGGNRPPTVETGVLLIGRGVVYRKTDETDLLRSKRGSCSSGGVWHTAK